ncbi:MAG: hypothetical protein ACKVRP_13700 [Bacteroidota bacterium]
MSTRIFEARAIETLPLFVAPLNFKFTNIQITVGTCRHEGNTAHPLTYENESATPTQLHRSRGLIDGGSKPWQLTGIHHILYE